MKKHSKNKKLNSHALHKVAQTFQALAVTQRLAILQVLQSGPKNVGEICATLQTTQPNISKHLKVMLEAGLVKSHPSGKQKFYEISDPMVFQLCDLVCGSIQKNLNQQLQVFDSPLLAKTKKPKPKRKVS